MATTNNTFNFKCIAVHSGQFHADDIFCVAMAQIIKPEIRIFRISDKDVEKYNAMDDVIVCDIGGGRYDHHQRDAKRRASGEKYAACGLFFEQWWPLLFPTEDTAKAFEEAVIIPIELQDNNGPQMGNPLSIMLGGLNPTDGGNADEAFIHAVEITKELILGQIAAAEEKVRKHLEIVAPAMEACAGTGLLNLPQFGKLDYAHDAGFKFALYPSNRGGYNIQQVDESLPAEWLEEKPQGCTFVHTGLFLAAFETKEAALEAVLPLVS